MKQLKLVLVMILGFLSFSFAQSKKPVLTATINTPNAQCDVCKQRIESFMTREEGVIKTVVDFRRKVTKVTYFTERTNIENIKTAIANLGFDADDVTANPEFYNKLPQCCKKTEDGGGKPPVKP
ncbi:MAG: heavy-metal-associated domain-containing protein [Williamsia sp.]|nr:heavy-metal-associated domain-containing protein [Williamsia sp.]